MGEVPFTLAHPAAVLPLRQRMGLPALVAGSIAPDVANYVPVPGGPDATHTLPAAMGLDVALGVALLAVFSVLHAPLMALAPPGLRERLGTSRWWARSSSVTGTLMTVASIAVGAVTHVLWDMVTHARSPVVQAWPWLRTTVAEPHTLYNVIGYVSSVGGLAVIGASLARWYRRTPPDTASRSPALPSRRRRWHTVALALAGFAGAAVGLTDPDAWISGYDLVRQLLIGATRGVLAALAIHALLWHVTAIRARSRRSRPTRSRRAERLSSGEVGEGSA